MIPLDTAYAYAEELRAAVRRGLMARRGRTGSGITRRHCKCKTACVRDGRTVCAKSCSHPDRYQVRKQMPDGDESNCGVWSASPISNRASWKL
jgi:hypothetical protein